jgi:hypothetical protein
MKPSSFLAAGAAAVLLLALAAPSCAGTLPADAKPASPKLPEMEVRITGEAMCAKCVLKESDHCQIVLQYRTLADKLVNYYLDDNDVARSFHDSVSQEARKTRATGLIKKVGDKLTFTASKLELVK